ncbi:hypothetical protein D3C77_477990 [compost metagenome]
MARQGFRQLLAQRLLFTARWRQLVFVQVQHQIALLDHVGAHRRQIARANIAPTAKRAGEFQIGNDLFQQR